MPTIPSYGNENISATLDFIKNLESSRNKLFALL